MAKYIWVENKDVASDNRTLMEVIEKDGVVVGYRKVTDFPPRSVITEEYLDEKIHEADPDFKGTFTSMADIEAIPDANANDWAYLAEQDAQGNEEYSRYRYIEGTGWTFEVCIKRDNFTDQEWAAITSGITSSKVQRLDEVDALVGDQVLTSLDRDNEGNVIGIYRTLDDDNNAE